MTELSYMGANLVAQQIQWNMTEGWMQGEDAANAWYAPIETFGERFRAFVDLVADAGFTYLDVWTAQLHWRWATPEHLRLAQSALAARGLTVTSYAGLFGDTTEEFATACHVAASIGAPVLSGNTTLLSSDRRALIAALEWSGVQLGIENHPETAPDQVLAKIGTDGHGRIGAAIDTGWWGTQGYDAAEAIRALGPHVVHVDLKDVLAAGAHETCALGDGVVPIAACVQALHDVGYRRPITIEHEPEHFDPMDDVLLSRERVLVWLEKVSVGVPIGGE